MRMSYASGPSVVTSGSNPEAGAWPASPMRKRTCWIRTSWARMVIPPRMSVMPGDGAVWPAMVTKGSLMMSRARLRSMMPPTSNTMMRGPGVCRASSSDPGPKSARLVTLMIAPPRPPGVSAPKVGLTPGMGICVAPPVPGLPADPPLPVSGAALPDCPPEPGVAGVLDPVHASGIQRAQRVPRVPRGRRAREQARRIGDGVCTCMGCAGGLARLNSRRPCGCSTAPWPGRAGQIRRS